MNEALAFGYFALGFQVASLLWGLFYRNIGLIISGLFCAIIECLLILFYK